MNLLSITVSIADAAILAVLGEGMVFVGLIALLVVVTLMGKAFTAKKAKKEAPAAPAAAPAAAPIILTAFGRIASPASLIISVTLFIRPSSSFASLILSQSALPPASP